jgi:hypothetical protein
MSGLLGFPRMPQGSARPPWCMARTLFASMQQCRPGCGGVCGRAEDVDAAGGVLDDGENVESRSGQGADVKEVGSEEGVCLAAQESGPGQVIAVRRRLDAVDLEDLPDGERGRP